jgi:hypothetical protein
MTMGELVEPAGLAPAPCGLKVRCAALTPQLRGARAGTRTRNCGLADRRVALTLRTHLKLSPAGLGRRLASWKSDRAQRTPVSD